MIKTVAICGQETQKLRYYNAERKGVFCVNLIPTVLVLNSRLFRLSS